MSLIETTQLERFAAIGVPWPGRGALLSVVWVAAACAAPPGTKVMQTNERAEPSSIEPEAASRDTCESEGIECGLALASDGTALDCGDCQAGTCGGGGPNRCGIVPCPEAPTCMGLRANCGVFSDECGSLINCGSCDEGHECQEDTQGFLWECRLPEDGCSTPLDDTVAASDLGEFLEGKWRPCVPHPNLGGFRGEEGGVEFTADGRWFALTGEDDSAERNGSEGTWQADGDSLMIDSLGTGIPDVSLEPKAMAIGVDPYYPRYVPMP